LVVIFLEFNRMVNEINEILEEVFDDLVALEDQDLSNNPIYMFPPPNGIQHAFNWQDAMHYMNLNGLKKAKEYLDEAMVILSKIYHLTTFLFHI